MLCKHIELKNVMLKWGLVSTLNGRQTLMTATVPPFPMHDNSKLKMLQMYHYNYASSIVCTKRKKRPLNARIARRHSNRTECMASIPPSKQLEPCLLSDKCFCHSIWQFTPLFFYDMLGSSTHVTSPATATHDNVCTLLSTNSTSRGALTHTQPHIRSSPYYYSLSYYTIRAQQCM